MFAHSRFISGDPDAGRRLYAALPDLKPKNLKRSASFRDSSNIETGESSTDAFFMPGQPDDCSAPQRQSKRPRFNSPPSTSTQDRFSLHGEQLWEGIGYTLDGPQRKSPSPVPTEPGTPPPSNEPSKFQSPSGVGATSPTNGSPRRYDRLDLFLDPNSVLPPRPIPTRPSESILEPAQGTSEPRPEVAMASPLANSDSRSLRREVSYSALKLCPIQQGSSQQNGIVPAASRPGSGLRRQQSRYNDIL
jgi:hypothetical protein